MPMKRQKSQIFGHFREIKARFLKITGGNEIIVVLEIELAGRYPHLLDSQNDTGANFTSFVACDRFGCSANGNRTRI
jgi:hypothetical protein